MGLLRSLWGFARTALLASSGLAGLGFALVVALQRKLIYVPSLPGSPRDDYPVLPNDPRLNLASEELWLTASDGCKLHAWLLGPAASGIKRGPTLIFFQENAGNIAHRLPHAKLLVDRLACNVLLVSYRGCARWAAAQPAVRHV
jgi:hypothetical protein